MLAINSSGFCLDGTTNAATEAAGYATLWCTEAITQGDWIAEYATDTTNPTGKPGNSYRKADSDNADALYGTVGIATQTTTAAGPCQVQVRGRTPAYANVDSGASVIIGDDLIIGATAGRAIEWTSGNNNVRLIGRCESTPSSNAASVTLYEHPKFAA